MALRRGVTPNTLPVVTLASGIEYSRELLLPGYIPGNDTSRLAVMNNGRLVRIKTGSGDHGDPSEISTGNERTELLLTNYKTKQNHLLAQNDEDYWFCKWFMVDIGDRIQADFTIVEQMHSVQGSLGVNRQPTTVFNLEPQTDGEYGRDEVRMNFQTRYSDPVAGTAVNVPSTTRWQKTLKRGRFYWLVNRLRYSLTGNGAIDVWVDGAQEASQTGLYIGYNEPGAPGAGYPQFGQYRHESPEDVVCYYGEVNHGKVSFASLINNPPPVPIVTPGWKPV